MRTVEALGHLAARLGAAAAGFGAALHHLIIIEAPALFSAAVADLSAGPAGHTVEIGSAQHEIGAGLADLGAVH